MKPNDEAATPVITLRSHPPERRRRSLAAPFGQGSAFAGCCCCCCCCLHSLGSLAGAAVGSFYPRGTPQPIEKPAPAELLDDELGEPVKPIAIKPPVNVIYWSAMVVVVIVGTVVLALQPGSSWQEGLLVPAICWPAIQLGLSLLTAVVIACVPVLRREPRAWKRLGWITVGTVLGCVLGILIMILIAIAMR